jgi:hypothetical protein
MGTRMPGEGFEPPTFGLQNRCTTTVLTRLKAREEIKINRTPPVAASLGTISDFPEMIQMSSISRIYCRRSVPGTVSNSGRPFGWGASGKI